MNTINSRQHGELKLKPVKGIENYWILGKSGVQGCIGIRFSDYYGGWQYQNLMDTPERAAQDLRSREQPRVSFGAYAASKRCKSALDVAYELYPV
jgi:hypothetical protein